MLKNLFKRDKRPIAGQFIITRIDGEDPYIFYEGFMEIEDIEKYDEVVIKIANPNRK